jgi:hypothetical protein
MALCNAINSDFVSFRLRQSNFLIVEKHGIRGSNRWLTRFAWNKAQVLLLDHQEPKYFGAKLVINLNDSSRLGVNGNRQKAVPSR